MYSNNNFRPAKNWYVTCGVFYESKHLSFQTVITFSWKWLLSKKHNRLLPSIFKLKTSLAIYTKKISGQTCQIDKKANTIFRIFLSLFYLQTKRAEVSFFYM